MLKLELIGNLGKDCSTNVVNGNHVINFSVAHSDKTRDQENNWIEKTVWVECAYWTEKTGVVNFLRKGQQVYAEGIPEVKTYTKKDGSTGISLTLRVIYLQLVGSISSDGVHKISEKEKEAIHSTVSDDLPF
ncbi:MAG: single-stranded DNA-binding protein [Bacteroidota bacterium]|jgi:single-strand DNA-binding protein